MAKTTINIPGVAPIEVGVAMSDITAIKNLVAADYPQVNSMDHSIVPQSNGDVVATFTQRTGNKG